MAKTLIARGQATINIQTDGYTITQSLGEYIFPADQSGKILSTVSVTSTIIVTQNNSNYNNFTIGSIIKPTGFSSITVNNTNKTVTFAVVANTTTLADHGKIDIPITISSTTYKLSFVWSKAKKGETGAAGADANLLDWVKEWNNGKNLINSNTVITPKIFAGTKNSDGTISGIAIGSFALSTKTASGTITTETVNGIYGFKDGYKTFFVDNGGNVQLGYGNEYIKYNASTGKIEFGSAVSMQWVGATYIDKDGIFTGTLSVDTVSAIDIAASQITSGKISATYINTDELKSTLITASNINALTLTTTKGTIGGWNINSDSIYRGTKKNTATTYTAASGSMTIGSTGIRGYKWRLESTGAGAVAGGNISWDASGNVTFANSVALNWTEPIDDITDALGGDDYPKLTKITAEGIYTGSITASQITAGTISADRIAAGSITATKLDAASIKSDIINTSYINGLECTFTKGSVGGWNISTDAISNENISIDCQKKRIVVFGEGCTPTSGQRVELYFNSDLDYGFYVTSYNGKCIAHLGSNNIIAGWFISTNEISKGNVILGSDGSITNKTKWKLNNDGSGQIASGNISWDASGNVTFKSTVSVAWTNGINSIKTALGGSNYPKLTHLTSTGIYTGTLTAEQINAVSIDASSITTGLLSAERISIGSITADKLDATSIKSEIINTNYINGLSCTFTTGSIGGFVIGNESLLVGNLGAKGETPLQIRSQSSGSGEWYKGWYKPLGVTLTWHQSNNAGHIVFGQIAASGKTVKTGFIGIQMMSWDGYEYFCLSANHTKSGGSEVYNRIAGWAFDHNHIWKNNIELSSDGSIRNGAKWKLNNDGSGQIASGNISWNTSGDITFSANVSAQWTTGITTAQELASAMAFGKMLYRDPTFISGNNSIAIYNNSSNGNVTHSRITDSTAPNDSKYVIKIQTLGDAAPKNGGFNFSAMCSNRKVLVCRFIAKIPVGHNVQFATNSIGTGGSSRWLTSNAGTGDWAEYIYKVVCGTANFSSTHFYYIDGEQGTADNPLIWYLAYATIFDLTSTEKYTTTIDANGVYTGTVKANQVIIDSALVVGGSSYNGSISVRDASNNVKVTLNRIGITAVAGNIGGWILNENSLTASTPLSNHRIAIESSGYIHHDNPSTSTEYWALKTDGSAIFSTGKCSFASDGSGFVAGGNLSWDSNGNIVAQKGTFKDVEIIGTVKNPFILNDSSIYVNMEDPQMNFNKYDHVVAVRGNWDENIPLPWGLEHSGRRVCLVNYKWGSNTTIGFMSITAPSGKYFYEDGISKSSITFSRELIELLGYGDDTTFFGWIVVNRLDLMTSKKYGKNLKFLIQGTVKVYASDDFDYTYQSFDGSTISVARLARGQYRIYLPTSWELSGYYTVFLSGIYSTIDNTPIYATLKSKENNYFDVYTQDDSTQNDGSFNFLVISTGDWKF